MAPLAAQTERPDIIIQYKGLTDITLTVIGNSGNSVIDPSDLEFHSDLSLNELWVTNKGHINVGGNCVIFSETGEAGQTSISQSDENKKFYMSRVSGLAFNEDGNFASSSGCYDGHHDGGDPYTGPTLWAGDVTIFGEPTAGDGSHIDDLHQSPYGQGIAWQTDNIFWVNDGYFGEVVSYNFGVEHGPGGSGSSDGIVHRYGGLGLQRDTDDVVVSHMAFDPDKEWLYVSDYGNQRVIRIDVATGTLGDTPFFGPFEPLAEYAYYEDFDWEVVVADTTLNPSGIILIGNKMLVADHATGDIIVYITEGPTAFEEWFRIETADNGIQGLEIGPDGRIFYANEANNKIRRLDSPALSLPTFEKSEKFALTIYPNPSKGIVNIETKINLQNAEVVVLDQSGKKVKTNIVVNGDYTASLITATLPAGIYSVKVLGEEGVAVSRLIVE